MKIVGNMVLVPITLNGTVFSFLLDTGSEQSSIDPKVAAHLGLASQRTERIQKNFRDLAVDVAEIGIVHIGTLSFNHVKMAEINLAPLSHSLGANVDGVLGNDLLQALTLKVSYSRQQIFVGPLQSLGPLGKPETLRRSGNQFLIAATFMSVPGQFVLDTGTNSTNLSWKTWEHLSQTSTPRPGLRHRLYRAYNAPETLPRRRYW
ncbi:MAG: retropepsin-like aspartic protease, partial [Candidatus Sulfotelmatobacter sp.]